VDIRHSRWLGRSLWLVTAVSAVVQTEIARTSAVFDWDFAVLWSSGRSLDQGHTPWTSGFVYLPGATVITAPFGLLSLHAARLVMLALTIALVIGTVAWMCKAAGYRLDSPAVPILAALAILFGPTLPELEMENFTIFALPAIAALCILASRQQWTGAAIVMALGLTAKPILIPALLIFVVYRRWRELAACLLGTAVLSGLALLIFGNVAGYARVASQTFRDDTTLRFSVSLTKILSGYGVPEVVRLALVVSVLALSALALLATVRRVTDPLLSATLVATIPMLVVYLLTSFTWVHYLVVLVPLLTLLALQGDLFARVIAAGVWILATLPVLVWGANVGRRAELDLMCASMVVLLGMTTAWVLLFSPTSYKPTRPAVAS
jgi:arabinofuranan 3-O-arabinosyltransferase